MLCYPSEYVWNVFIYCGKLDPISGFGHAETVVLKLLEKLLECVCVLYLDNFHTSVPSAEELLERKTLPSGTLRKNRKHLPKRSALFGLYTIFWSAIFGLYSTYSYKAKADKKVRSL